MIQALLGEYGIPSMAQRSVDAPQFMAAGPRQILVPEAVAGKAREILADTPGRDTPSDE